MAYAPPSRWSMGWGCNSERDCDQARCYSCRRGRVRAFAVRMPIDPHGRLVMPAGLTGDSRRAYGSGREPVSSIRPPCLEKPSKALGNVHMRNRVRRIPVEMSSRGRATQQGVTRRYWLGDTVSYLSARSSKTDLQEKAAWPPGRASPPAETKRLFDRQFKAYAGGRRLHGQCSSAFTRLPALTLPVGHGERASNSEKCRISSLHANSEEGRLRSPCLSLHGHYYRSRV